MKFVRFATAAALLALSGPVLAQSATTDVVVDAVLTSACRFSSGSSVNLTANYPAFSATAVAPSQKVTIECTRGGSTPVINFAGGPIGVVGGLAFQLSAQFAELQAGTAPLGALITDLGAARRGEFTVAATFPAGQAGTTGTTSPVTKQMTITF